MTHEHKMYNPKKPITPVEEIGDSIMLDINRTASDTGNDWADHYRLIENVLCRDSEVLQSAVHPDGQTIYVALAGELYDVDQLEDIDTRLRQLIGRAASFDFSSQE